MTGIDDIDDDIHASAALYAVDALEPGERAAFEEHLRGCAFCRREAAGYAEVGARLAAGLAQEPPGSLREDVLAGIRDVEPLPEDRPGAPAATVVSLGARRRRRPRLLAAAAAAVLVPGVALGGWALGVQGERAQQEELAAAGQERAEQERARQDRLLSAPDVVARTLEVEGRTATLVGSRETGEALLVSSGLPDPGEGREYQLWLMEDGTSVPDVRFSGGQVRTWLAGDVAGAAAVAMTIEPAGGSASPTLPVVASAEL